MLARCGLRLKRLPERTVVTTPADFEPAVPGDGRSALRPGVARLEGVVQPAGGAEPDAGPLPGGGQHPSGAGRADGGAVRAAWRRRACCCGTSASTSRSCRDGYVWWYVDALSDDGRHGLTLIAFIGSVFSPYYAWRGGAAPATRRTTAR